MYRTVPYRNMPPLKAAEIVAHPAFKHVEWKLPATTSGKVDVAKGRSGGPIGLYYEIHGNGDRRVVVSVCFSLPFGLFRSVL